MTEREEEKENKYIKKKQGNFEIEKNNTILFIKSGVCAYVRYSVYHCTSAIRFHKHEETARTQYSEKYENKIKI